jgi:carbon monoxide dehydrogenase subunit G
MADATALQVPPRLARPAFLAALLGMGLWFLSDADFATSDHAEEIAVQVQIQGELVRVDADVPVHATPREVWDVLTDFDHLPRFVSNIKSSKVLSREGNIVRVAQTGKASVGPLSFEFESEREITLNPYAGFESLMLKGNMKRFHGTTRLEAIDGITHIRYHSEAVPETLPPFGLGRSFIEAETREHYQDIRREVLRRKSAVAHP